jgi:hydroxypyruvate isomerase
VKFAFCLEMLYTDLPFMDRLIEAKDDGIEVFEMWGWRDKDLNALKEQMQSLNLRISNISGNREYGMIDPDEQIDFLNEIRQTGIVAQILDCPTLMLIVQSLEADGGGKLPQNELSPHEIETNIIKCGKAVGDVADELNLNFVIEPLNEVLDHPRYVLYSSEMAFRIIETIDHPRVNLLYDIYHMAMQNEDVFADIEQHLDSIGYIHVADKPGRFEPGTGKINYQEIFRLLHEVKYGGVVGFECLPSHGDSRKVVQKLIETYM